MCMKYPYLSDRILRFTQRNYVLSFKDPEAAAIASWNFMCMLWEMERNPGKYWL